MSAETASPEIEQTGVDVSQPVTERATTTAPDVLEKLEQGEIAAADALARFKRIYSDDDEADRLSLDPRFDVISGQFSRMWAESEASGVYSDD